MDFPQCLLSNPPFMQPTSLLPLLCLALAACGDPSATAPASPSPPPKPVAKSALPLAPVSYKENVATVFLEKCARCHIEDRKGGLSLASFAELMKGGKDGPVVVAGKPGESRLMQLIKSGEMPKDGEPLSEEYQRDIREWIEAGAEFDGPDPAARHSSYVVLPEELMAGDGREGRGGPGGGRGGPGGRGGNWDPVGRFDRDGDRKLSREEMPERMRERFAELDADKDGFVTGDEFRSGMRSRFGGGPGERPARSQDGDAERSGDRPKRPPFDQ